MKKISLALLLASFSLAHAEPDTAYHDGFKPHAEKHLSKRANAASAHKGPMESCMKAALAKHPGDVISLEAEIENGKPIYEFDIKGKDGKEWEVECDAKTGKVTEEEEEVDAKDPRFASKAKVTFEEAKKTALAAHPGEVIESETSIEADGSISYEFDIKGKDGKEWEVEVDAVTGKIVETEEEVYQIGLD